MKSHLKIALAIALLTTTVEAKSKDNEKFVHAVAHISASYAINTFSYGFCHNVLRMPKLDSIVVSTVFTLLVGASYKIIEAEGTIPRDFKRSMTYNAIGTAAGVGTIVSFGF